MSDDSFYCLSCLRPCEPDASLSKCCGDEFRFGEESAGETARLWPRRPPASEFDAVITGLLKDHRATWDELARAAELDRQVLLREADRLRAENAKLREAFEAWRVAYHRLSAKCRSEGRR